MPAPIAPLVGLLIGASFHWNGSRQLARAAPGTAVEARGLLLAAAYALLIYAPICGYFLAFAPDWTFVYTVETERLNRALIVLALLGSAASVPLGFHLARRFMRRNTPGAIARVLVPACALILIFFAFAMRRLGVAGTYAQYHGNFGVQPLSGSPLGYALLWMGAILAGVTLWTAKQYRKLGQ